MEYKQETPTHCPEGMHWRKAHSRRLRSGEVINVPGQCVANRGQGRKSPYRSELSKTNCKEGEYWRKAYSVTGKCIKRKPGAGPLPKSSPKPRRKLADMSANSQLAYRTARDRKKQQQLYKIYGSPPRDEVSGFGY
jgi:hypothetical protein